MLKIVETGDRFVRTCDAIFSGVNLQWFIKNFSKRVNIKLKIGNYSNKGYYSENWGDFKMTDY